MGLIQLSLNTNERFFWDTLYIWQDVYLLTSQQTMECSLDADAEEMEKLTAGLIEWWDPG